ncbi:MAG: hypothetical protein M3186_04345, partial [Actinomycetota bacterium]|nr:hypothetical protein [Actinomycetota bacterium]
PPRRPTREAIWIHETAFPRSVLVAARRRRLDTRTLLATLRTRRAPTGAFYSDRDPLPLLLETAKVANKTLRAALTIARKSQERRTLPQWDPDRNGSQPHDALLHCDGSALRGRRAANDPKGSHPAG